MDDSKTCQINWPFLRLIPTAAATSVGPRNFSLHQNVQAGSGAPSRTLSAYRKYLPGVKRSGREINHSAPYSTRLKTGAAVPLHPLYSVMAWTRTTSPVLIFVLPFSDFVPRDSRFRRNSATFVMTVRPKAILYTHSSLLGCKPPWRLAFNY